ncbi:hypothetical protein [Crassaminicella profunda]|uniref:hypothetical protein n=1 Tax=Crassaminicella profunda TaxID=1286698 RepID=UPI001CA6CDFE|nr:hypothetical protein [Crassaminicella profunda]QZY55745.1 hypothetical protein K7H06_01635 [Crassaminicella profunda]
MNTSIIILLVGIFTIICTLTKPAFYWESRKARGLRRFIGDGGATIVYLLLGVFFLGFSITNLLGFTHF